MLLFLVFVRKDNASLRNGKGKEGKIGCSEENIQPHINQALQRAREVLGENL